jgi:hypothetical protein
LVLPQGTVVYLINKHINGYCVRSIINFGYIFGVAKSVSACYTLAWLLRNYKKIVKLLGKAVFFTMQYDNIENEFIIERNIYIHDNNMDNKGNITHKTFK